MTDIIYICIELDSFSKALLVNLANRIKLHESLNIDKMYCHHMTVAFKTQLDDEILSFYEDNKGREYTLNIIGYGLSDKSCAVKVETDCPSKNRIKHITLFTMDGGKPKDSNDIDTWVDCFTDKVKIKGKLVAVSK